MHLASASGPSYKHVIHVHLARDGASGSALGREASAKRRAPVPPWTSPESPASSVGMQARRGTTKYHEQLYWLYCKAEHHCMGRQHPSALPVKERAATNSTKTTTAIPQFRKLRRQGPLELLPGHSIRLRKPQANHTSDHRCMLHAAHRLDGLTPHPRRGLNQREGWLRNISQEFQPKRIFISGMEYFRMGVPCRRSLA